MTSTTADNAPMRIGFDTTACYVTRAGIARYVRCLKRAIEQTSQPDVQLIPVAWEVENFGYAQPWRALKTAYRELLWGRFIAPVQLREAGAHLLHSTSSLFIRRPAEVRHVVTLHDLAISRHPERFRPWQIRSWKRRLPVIASADRVICISRFTADEAMSLLGLSAGRIDVVHNGCDWHEEQLAFKEEAPQVAVPSEFFLFVGTLEPGKNLALLRQSWLAAEAQGKRLPPLVIVGARREGVVNEGAHPAGWIHLGSPSDAVLLYLYRRALALVFPSTYEGFGLPVVEAMGQGCPVLCSPVSSLPEVAGDAALLVPHTPDNYLAALRELAARSELRTDLARRGHAQARQFTWRRCAEETIAVYRNTLG